MDGARGQIRLSVYFSADSADSHKSKASSESATEMKASLEATNKQSRTKAPQRRGRPRVEGIQSTRWQLLDAAEYLFAEWGYHGVTVRDIAKRAKVQLGLLSYHFPTKELLFTEVLQRRSPEHVRNVAASLQEVMVNSKGRPTSEELIRAYVEPPLRAMQRSKGWSNYIRLLAREGTYSMKQDPFERITTKMFDPIERQFVEALARVFPDAEETKLWNAFHCLCGVAVYTFMDLRYVQRMSRGAANPDFEQLCADIVQFVSAGYAKLARP
jgi:AcrR family transcriptional regulator